LRRSKRLVIKVLLLLVVLLVVGLASLGCIKGLQPIGWSGGEVSGDTLLVGSKEGRLVAVNVVDTSRKWSEPLKKASGGGGFGCAPAMGGGGCAGSSGVAIYGTPAADGDLVYLGGYNGKIYAFNADSLGVRWVYPREDNLEPFVGGPVVAQGNIYIGGSDGKVYALDAATGDKQWEYQTGDKVWATPAFADGTLFIGSFDNKLYALNAADGSLKWEFPTEGGIAATPLVYDNTVYIGSFDRYFYAVNAANGSLRWKFAGENWFWAEPVAKNTIYAGCLDGKVYALQADNGAKVAEFDLGSPVSSSPVMVGNSIIFASRDGLVYNLDTGSNELRQIADIEAEVYGPLCQSEGVVYIHTQDLTLHRVNASTGAILMSISLKSKD